MSLLPLFVCCVPFSSIFLSYFLLFPMLYITSCVSSYHYYFFSIFKVSSFIFPILLFCMFYPSRPFIFFFLSLHFSLTVLCIFTPSIHTFIFFFNSILLLLFVCGLSILHPHFSPLPFGGLCSKLYHSVWFMILLHSFSMFSCCFGSSALLLLF